MTEDETREIVQRIKQHEYRSNNFKRMLKPRNNFSTPSLRLSHTIILCIYIIHQKALCA